MRVAAENSADKLLRVRLQVLREPDFERHAAGAIHAGRNYFADAGFLPAQLHRRTVPELGDYSKPGLHDGAACGRRSRAADAASIQWLHSFEGDSRSVAGNH